MGVEGEVWSGTVGSSVKAIKKIRHATRAMPFIPATHSDGSVCAAQVQRAGCGERYAGDTRDISVAAAVHHKHRQAHRQASPAIPCNHACPAWPEVCLCAGCSCDGYSLDPPMLYVVMEMCTGSLHGLLHGTPQITLTPAQRQQLAQQAAQGVAHLHTHALVHRQRHPLPDETHSVC